MTRRTERDTIYRCHRFSAETIEFCVRWYTTYRLSYRDLAAMMAEREVIRSGCLWRSLTRRTSTWCRALPATRCRLPICSTREPGPASIALTNFGTRQHARSANPEYAGTAAANQPSRRARFSHSSPGAGRGRGRDSGAVREKRNTRGSGDPSGKMQLSTWVKLQQSKSMQASCLGWK